MPCYYFTGSPCLCTFYSYLMQGRQDENMCITPEKPRGNEREHKVSCENGYSTSPITCTLELLQVTSNSKWSENPANIKKTALALRYTTAQHAYPHIWERSAHAHEVGPVLIDSCRSITGCLKATNVKNVYLFAGTN